MKIERPKFTTTEKDARGARWRHLSALVSVFVLSIVFGTLLIGARPAKAQGYPVVDWPAYFDRHVQVVENTLSNTLVEAAVVSVVNGINYFTQQLAYQAAVALTSACPGQVICWNSQSFDTGFTQAWQGAIGEAIGTLSSQSGLTALGFNLCAPNINLMLKIQLGLMPTGVPAPACSFGSIVSNWSNLGNSLATGQALGTLKTIFQPGQAPLSVSLGVFDAISAKQSQAAQSSVMKYLMDASAGGGFSSLSDPVSGRIKSPQAVVLQEFQNMKNQQNSAIDNTQKATAGSIAKGAVISVVVTATQTFVQTFVANMLNKGVVALMSALQEAQLQPDIVLNPDAELQPAGVTGAEQIATETTVTPHPLDSGLLDPILNFSTCPSVGRLPDNCVLDQQLANAIRIADATPMTIADALKQDVLHGSWPLISSADTQKDQDTSCYSYGYCESNLKKMRAARIISIGWEIAASESPVDNPITLQTVVDGFNDCNDNGEWDTEHPYCKLIDPDWVLRIPLTQCLAMGYGEDLVSTDSSTRAQSCVDQQTCLKQDDQGNCVGGWGYCTEERSVWRFNADSCPAQYNSCRVLTSSTGTVVDFNVNTIDHSVCNADNVGCSQYSLAQNVVSCTLKDGQGNSIACTDPNGCDCTQKRGDCIVSLGGSSCSDNAGEVCRLQGICTTTGGCDCPVQSTCHVVTGDVSCQSTSGSSATTADDWQTDPSRFFNAQVKSCDASAAGCSALVPLATGQSLNLVRNGGFETREDADNDGQPDHAQYWSPFGVVPSGASGEISSDGTEAVSGNNAMLISGLNNSTTVCSQTNICTSTPGCTCQGATREDAGYSCLIPTGATSCSLIKDVSQTGIRVSGGKTYTLSFSLVPNQVKDVGVSAWLYFYDYAGNLVQPITKDDVVATSSITGNDPSKSTTVNCAGGQRNGIDGNPDPFQDMAFTVNATKLAGATRSVDASCTFVVTPPKPIAFAMLVLESDGNVDSTYVDNVQLEEGGGTSFHEGYGGATSIVDAKIPPAYLGCTGNDSDLPDCSNYADVCSANEVGCDLYTPANGDPSIPAIAGPQDSCPAECVGYDVFKKAATQFDQEQYPVYFIPQTAASCSEADVGCSQFTNVQNESVAYYSQLRLCVQPNDPTVGTYYTWEGSDTTGYQLVVWNLKKTVYPVTPGTDATGAPVSDSTLANDVCATAGCTNVGPAPCTALDSATASKCTSVDTNNSLANGGSTAGFCTRADIDNGNFDCREFYDANGNRHYRLLPDTIIASASCSSYRITTSTQADCAASNGRWDSTLSQCIYAFDPTQSRSCSASANECRAYQGNASTNVRTVVLDDFESSSAPLANWTDASDAAQTNLRQSSQSLTVGGHSLDIETTADGTGRVARREVGGMVAPSRSYTLTFWAQGSGDLKIDFDNGKSSPDCTLASSCQPVKGMTTCSCTTGNNLTCSVGQADTSCTPVTTTPAQITCNLGSLCTSTSGCPCTTATNQSCNVTSGASSCVTTGSTTAAIFTSQLNLSSQWKQYSFGPVSVNPPAPGDEPWGSASTKLEFVASGVCSEVAAGKSCTSNDDCWAGILHIAGTPLGICNQSDIFIDNVQLKEVQDSIFVVRNSWNTPASCDETSAGAVSPQEMLGCKDYKNAAGNDVYLRSFSQLCRARSVGCAAYSNTQNTQTDPYAQSFNADCRIYEDDGVTPRKCGFVECRPPGTADSNSIAYDKTSGKCTTQLKDPNTLQEVSYSCNVTAGSDRCEVSIPADAGAACACNYDTKNPLARSKLAPIILPDVCQVAVGDSDCSFNYDGWDYSTRPDETPDRVNVDTDSRVYLAINPTTDMCTSDQVGCTTMGQPHLSYEGQCTLPTACADKRCTVTNTICNANSDCEKVAGNDCRATTCTCGGATLNTCTNKPDSSGDTRCYNEYCQNDPAIGCQIGRGNNGGCGPGDTCVAGSCGCGTGSSSCLIPDGQNQCSVNQVVNTNGSCQVPFGQKSCVIPYQNAVTDKWASATIMDDPTAYGTTLCKQEALACDAYSSAGGTYYFKNPGDHICTYQEGVVYNGEQVSGWFRQSALGAIFPCYPELLEQGFSYAIYKNADPVCSQEAVCSTAGGCPCYLPGNSQPVCKIVEGSTICGYQGWVGQCQAQYDQCEEFVDPNQTTDAYPAGTPYYYIQNGKLDTSSCTGEAGLKQGCVAFDQTSNTAKLYSAATTYYESATQQQNGEIAPINCALSPHDPACDNRCFSIPSGLCVVQNTPSYSCHDDADCRRCPKHPDIVCSDTVACPSGDTCPGSVPQNSCVGVRAYTSACMSDSDCEKGIGERCAGVGHCSVTASQYCNADVCTLSSACSPAAGATEL
jgi:hypothetical protein